MIFYNKLAATPLFQGLTNSDLTQIIGQTKFSFYKFASDKTIRNEGEPCRSMAFLLSGTARVITYSDDHGFSVEETIAAPYILQPERLFGLNQRYTHNFIANSECDIMEIDKNDILRLTDEFVILRINLLNIISTLSQKATRPLWQPSPDNDEGRIIRFLKSRCSSPVGKKTIRIKMTRLAQETGLGRLAVSKELNRLQERRLLVFSRGIISITNMEKL